MVDMRAVNEDKKNAQLLMKHSEPHGARMSLCAIFRDRQRITALQTTLAICAVLPPTVLPMRTVLALDIPAADDIAAAQLYRVPS
jgi:hypothetical protein